MRGGEEVSRQAHNLKNGGASPSPATKNKINIIYNMAGSTEITQNMNPTTGTTIVSKPTTDPNAKKCFTEWELGKKSCWTWGARKSSLSTTYCPTKSLRVTSIKCPLSKMSLVFKYCDKIRATVVFPVPGLPVNIICIF